jgi:hypothetical protein
MSKQRDNSPSGNELHQRFSNAPWGAFAIAGAILVVGGAFVLSLPGESQNPAPAAVTPAKANTEASASTDAASDTLCERQTWPYIDQRCAQRVNTARDTRKVRIVTDKGDSVTAVTPVPIVEPKDKPKPAPQPTVAHNDTRTVGPTAAPGAPADEAPQEQTAAAPRQPQPPAPPQDNARQAAPAPVPVVATATPAPQPAAPPAATNAMAQDNSKPANNTKTASVAPTAASAEPMSPGVDAMDNPPPKKSKAERAAEKTAEKKAKRESKREAKRRLKNDNDDADEEIAATRPAPLEERGARDERRARTESNARRGRSAVPDDVLAEVERATRGREDGGRRRIVVGDPRGQRVIIVPSEGGW